MNSSISNSNELQSRISVLQLQANEERLALKQEVIELINTIHPIKLLTQGFKEIIHSKEVKDGLFSLSIGMSAGYVAKKIVIGKSDGTLQHIAGNMIGMLVSKNVALHSDQIKSAGLFVLKGLFSSKNEEETER